MQHLLFIFIFSTLLITQPLFAQDTNLKMSVGTSTNSKNTLGLYNNLRPQNKSNINFNLEYSKRNLSSQLSLNFDETFTFILNHLTIILVNLFYITGLIQHKINQFQITNFCT